jgi:hypothetical protein
MQRRDLITLLGALRDGHSQHARSNRRASRRVGLTLPSPWRTLYAGVNKCTRRRCAANDSEGTP